jgi:hypothetical protein
MVCTLVLGITPLSQVMLVAEIKTVLTHVQLTWLLWVSASL